MIMYHGTATENVADIMREGLLPNTASNTNTGRVWFAETSPDRAYIEFLNGTPDVTILAVDVTGLEVLGEAGARWVEVVVTPDRIQ